VQLSNQGAPLLRPEQVRVIEDSKQIVLIKGQPPLRMDKVKYYSDRILKRLFDAQTGPLPEPDPIDMDQFAPQPLEKTLENEPVVSPPGNGGPSPFLSDDPAQTGASSETAFSAPQEETSGGGGGDPLEFAPEKAAEIVTTAKPAPQPPRLTEEEMQALNQQRLILDRIIALQKGAAHHRIPSPEPDNQIDYS
jgi:type IV secretion system protein VirD4